MIATAIVALGYAIGAGEHLSDFGWVVVVMFLALGGLALRRAATWNAPVYCRRCGAALTPEDRACPQCGLDLEKTAWAVIGTYKLR